MGNRMRYFLTVMLVVPLLGAPAHAQFRVFVGDRPDSENANSENTASARRELIKQEPQLDTSDPTEDLPVVKKSLKPGEVLSGNVVERELAIEWDSWRNRFARAVRDGMFSNVYEALNVPKGAITWYHCEVTRDKQLQNIKITKSSGDFWYDSAVIKALNKLNGSDLLSFPVNTSRTLISTDIGIQFGAAKRSSELNFNDVEYRQLSPTEKYEPEKEATESSPAVVSRKRRHHLHD